MSSELQELKDLVSSLDSKITALTSQMGTQAFHLPPGNWKVILADEGNSFGIPVEGKNLRGIRWERSEFFIERLEVYDSSLRFEKQKYYKEHYKTFKESEGVLFEFVPLVGWRVKDCGKVVPLVSTFRGEVLEICQEAKNFVGLTEKEFDQIDECQLYQLFISRKTEVTNRL